MSVNVVSIAGTASKLMRPFSLVPLMTVSDLAISVYMCQGQMKWHEHADEDELFLVHEGVVSLETERGTITLHSEEVSVVPKGIRHRTRSTLRSVVVLIRAAVLTDRKNGHRHREIAGNPAETKVRLAQVLAAAGQSYRPLPVARVEDFELQLFKAEGTGVLDMAPAEGMPLLVVRGGVAVHTGDRAVTHLVAGDMALIGAGQQFQLSAAETSMVLTLARISGK
jgi:mannose-6-phosphate isomerase-like protein (cupin superfamily)